MNVNILASILKRQFPDVSNITTKDLQHVIDKSSNPDQLLIIDTRTKTEYEISFIFGARHLEFPASEDDVQMFADKNISDETDTVVCYCSLGYRSSKVAQSLSKILSKDQRLNIRVYNLEGSIFQWVNEGRVLSSVTGEVTQSCHPFSYMWGLLGLSRDKWRWS